MVDFNYIKFLNENFSHDRVNLFFKLLDLLRVSNDYTDSAEDLEDLNVLIDRIYRLDPVIATSALSDKNLVTKFFESIIDQQAHFSLDYRRMRRFIIDWYATNRSLVSSMRHAIDPYYLTNEELDELIKGYGFPYANKIISKGAKVGFLYSLINYQSRKGTPYVFADALKHFGLSNTIVSEWWLHRNPATEEFYFKSRPIYPRAYRSDATYILEKTFDEVVDPFWFQTQSQLATAYSNSVITLPSISPFISLHTTLDINKLTPGIAALQRWTDETYQFWVEYVLQSRSSVYGVINDPSILATSGYRYIIGGSPLGEFAQRSNYYALYASGSWVLKAPTKNDCVLNNVTGTHWVYNDLEWVDLGVVLPADLLATSKTGSFTQNIPLTNFRHMYSTFEVLLSINYLFDSGNPTTTDNKYVYYQGNLAPFDKGVNESYSGYSGISGYSGFTNTKDNMIDDPDRVFGRVQDQWNSLTKRPDSRAIRDRLSARRDSIFTGDLHIEGSSDYTSHAPVAQINSAVFLNAVNGTFKGDLDNTTSYKDSHEVLRLLLLDFEKHLMEVNNMIDIPFTYLLLAIPIKDTLKDVVNYFKPYRARLLDITTDFGIIDPLSHSMLLSDSFSYDISESHTSRLDNLIDLFETSIEQSHTDHIHRKGMDPYYFFDLGLKDSMMDLIRETKHELGGIRLEEVYKETFNLVFGDQCPGDASNFDASTVTDSITIEIVEL